MDLSIVIVNYNTRGLLKYCLKNILELNLPFDFEIIVVDNNSQDSSVEIMKSLYLTNPKIRLIESKQNLGYSAGNNLAIKKAKGKYLFIFNPDIKPLPGSIDKLYDFMEQHPQVGLAGPKLINADGSLQYSCFRFPKFLIPVFRRTPLGRLPFARKKIDWYLMKNWDHNETKPVDWLLGSALVVRKDALERVGLFDERFYLYFSDVDWAKRFWLNDYQVYYVAPAQVIHLHRRESADTNWLESLFDKVTRIHIKEWLKYFWKYRNKSQCQSPNFK
jgi:hypothetical protein